MSSQTALSLQSVLHKSYKVGELEQKTPDWCRVTSRFNSYNMCKAHKHIAFPCPFPLCFKILSGQRPSTGGTLSLKGINMQGVRKAEKLYFLSQWAQFSITIAIILGIQILKYHTVFPWVAVKTISSNHEVGFQMCSLNFNDDHADEQNNAHFWWHIWREWHIKFTRINSISRTVHSPAFNLFTLNKHIRQATLQRLCANAWQWECTPWCVWV